MSGPWTAVNDLAETGTYVTGLNTSVSDVTVKYQFKLLASYVTVATHHICLCTCMRVSPGNDTSHGLDLLDNE